MICKIRVQVIYRSLEDSSPHVNIVRQKLQYARKFVLFGLEIQQIQTKSHILSMWGFFLYWKLQIYIMHQVHLRELRANHIT